MKKIFFSCIIIASSTHILFAMEHYNNLVQTVYDKWDPTIIVEELRKDGISPDPRIRMTQMHRLDRIIPYYTEREETANLCSTLNQIVANKWPLSSLALDMAADYLWKKRPAISNTNKPLLKEINLTLDIIDPTQIIRDIEKGQLYHEKPIDIENRVFRALDQLIQLKKIDDLKKLIIILTTPNPKLSIIPGERILNELYQCLRLQEKENKKYKKKFLDTFTKIKKNDSESDKESDKKEPDKN